MHAQTLETITVTAQRRETDLQSTPVAISAYTGEALAENKIFTVNDLASSVPAFSLTALTPLDAEQGRRFLHAAREDRFEALYVLSLTTGLRMGEALGLRWSDIDLDAGTLRVNRQVQRMRGGRRPRGARRSRTGPGRGG